MGGAVARTAFTERPGERARRQLTAARWGLPADQVNLTPWLTTQPSSPRFSASGAPVYGTRMPLAALSVSCRAHALVRSADAGVC